MQQLILNQLQEITKLCTANQLKLERLDTVVGEMQKKQEKEEAYLNNELKNLDDRLNNLEGFKSKMLVAASVMALVVTALWEVVSKLLLPLI